MSEVKQERQNRNLLLKIRQKRKLYAQWTWEEYRDVACQRREKIHVDRAQLGLKLARNVWDNKNNIFK